MAAQKLTDDQARDLSSWLTKLRKQCEDRARTYLVANPDRRFVHVQPSVPGPDGETVELGEPLLYSRSGLGL